ENLSLRLEPLLAACCEGPYSTEAEGDDALLLGEIAARRTQALSLTERHRLPVECGFDAGIEHLNRQPEARHGVPVGVGAEEPEVEARVAFDAAPDPDVLVHSARTGVTAEQATVDYIVVVPDLRVGPVHRGRDIGQPEVLVTRARRPGSGQLELTAVDEDAIRDHAERDRVATTEQARAAQVAAAGVSGRADAVAVEAAEVIAWAKRGRLDVDARQHRPAPLVIRIATSRGAGLRTIAAGARNGRGPVGGLAGSAFQGP